MSKNFIINERIRAQEVRLIDHDGSQLGIVSLSNALSRAQEKELDLILVSPNSSPPVCKIGDVGKLKYEQTKKEKEAKKSQKSGSIKEIKLTPKIGKHDLDVRIKHSIEFLNKGHKVKVTLFFRGREITHIDIGRKLVNQMVAALDEVGKVEQEPKMEGKRMHLIIGPK